MTKEEQLKALSQLEDKVVVIRRVHLLNKFNLSINDPWPGSNGHPAIEIGFDEKGAEIKVPLNAKVGAIFFVPESREIFTEEDDEPEEPTNGVSAAPGDEDTDEDEDDSDSGAEETKIIPAHYLVWSEPRKDMRCFRIWASNVMLDEQGWPWESASELIHSLMLDMITVDPKELEALAKATQPEPVVEPAPVAAAS